MMIVYLATTCELPPIEIITTRVRMPDFRLVTLLTKSTPLTVEEWAYVGAVEAATGEAELAAPSTGSRRTT